MLKVDVYLFKILDVRRLRSTLIFIITPLHAVHPDPTWRTLTVKFCADFLHSKAYVKLKKKKKKVVRLD